MGVENVICMNGGDGERSYAQNSLLPKIVLLQARPVLENVIKDYFLRLKSHKCIKVAELGCSSGPNTLLVITNIMDTIYKMAKEMKRESPEFQVFLNDLPDNDFNTTFKNIPPYYNHLKKEKGDKFGPCFISGVPGSFYERLFPSNSLNIVHSSYSLHWLSQVPRGLENNKGNIYMAKSSPPEVFKAYKEQFQRDFSTFLLRRSEEIVARGCMILTLIGRSIADPTSKDCCILWELLSKSLLDLVAEGILEETAVDSFNMPYYTPYSGEVSKIVQEEGSFNLDSLQVFEVNWDPNDDVYNKDFVFNKHQSSQYVAGNIRSVTEPMLARHFGEAIMDKLFARYKTHVADHLSKEKTKHVNVVVSLSRKGPMK